MKHGAAAFALVFIAAAAAAFMWASRDRSTRELDAAGLHPYDVPRHEMRSVIVIPARLAASRLPNKPLAVLGGLPLVVRVAQQANKCAVAGSVIVATDAQRVADVAQAHGIEAVLTRPEHPSGTDRVAEVVAGSDAEIIVNLQADEPFIDPRDLDTVITTLEQTDADIVTLDAPIEDGATLADPNVVKVVKDDHDRALYFSRAPIPFDRDGDKGVTGARMHIGVYGYRRAALERMCAAPVHPLEARERLEQLRAMALGLTIIVKEALGTARGIDTVADYEWATQRVARMGEAAFP